ncbi:MAG: hypothetical protein HY664_00385 [Chloroflexi bacterium]|nr:hypothetical protein [Chloroflexota bacterium]
MWHRRRHFFTFGFGIPPFDFYFRRWRRFPNRSQYLEMLEEYKAELEEELKEVEAEIAELKKE